MTEETKQRILADAEKIMNNLPADAWYQCEMPKLIKQYTSLLSGKRKQMPTWQQFIVIDNICKQYGMSAVWNDRTKICYIHVSDAPSCFNDKAGNCVLTYYGMFTASQALNNIYDVMQQTKIIFTEKYADVPVLADSISRLNQVTI